MAEGHCGRIYRKAEVLIDIDFGSLAPIARIAGYRIMRIVLEPKSAA